MKRGGGGFDAVVDMRDPPFQQLPVGRSVLGGDRAGQHDDIVERGRSVSVDHRTGITRQFGMVLPVAVLREQGRG